MIGNVRSIDRKQLDTDGGLAVVDAILSVVDNKQVNLNSDPVQHLTPAVKFSQMGFSPRAPVESDDLSSQGVVEDYFLTKVQLDLTKLEEAKLFEKNDDDESLVTKIIESDQRIDKIFYHFLRESSIHPQVKECSLKNLTFDVLRRTKSSLDFNGMRNAARKGEYVLLKGRAGSSVVAWKFYKSDDFDDDDDEKSTYLIFAPKSSNFIRDLTWNEIVHDLLPPSTDQADQDKVIPIFIRARKEDTLIERVDQERLYKLFPISVATPKPTRRSGEVLPKEEVERPFQLADLIYHYRELNSLLKCSDNDLCKTIFEPISKLVEKAYSHTVLARLSDVPISKTYAVSASSALSNSEKSPIEIVKYISPIVTGNPLSEGKVWSLRWHEWNKPFQKQNEHYIAFPKPIEVSTSPSPSNLKTDPVPISGVLLGEDLMKATLGGESAKLEKSHFIPVCQVDTMEPSDIMGSNETVRQLLFSNLNKAGDQYDFNTLYKIYDVGKKFIAVRIIKEGDHLFNFFSNGKRQVTTTICATYSAYKPTDTEALIFEHGSTDDMIELGKFFYKYGRPSAEEASAWEKYLDELIGYDAGEIQRNHEQMCKQRRNPDLLKIRQECAPPQFVDNFPIQMSLLSSPSKYENELMKDMDLIWSGNEITTKYRNGDRDGDETRKKYGRAIWEMIKPDHTPCSLKKYGEKTRFEMIKGNRYYFKQENFKNENSDKSDDYVACRKRLASILYFRSAISHKDLCQTKSLYLTQSDIEAYSNQGKDFIIERMNQAIEAIQKAIIALGRKKRAVDSLITLDEIDDLTNFVEYISANEDIILNRYVLIEFVNSILKFMGYVPNSRNWWSKWRQGNCSSNSQEYADYLKTLKQELNDIECHEFQECFYARHEQLRLLTALHDLFKLHNERMSERDMMRQAEFERTPKSEHVENSTVTSTQKVDLHLTPVSQTSIMKQIRENVISCVSFIRPLAKYSVSQNWKRASGGSVRR